MKYDFIYDTNTSGCEHEYELKRDGVVTILLEKENLVLEVCSQGDITLCDIDGKSIATKKVEPQKYPDRNFNSVLVKFFDSKVELNMLINKTVDNYPHCDGEYDRWSTIRIENIPVTLKIK